MNVEVLPDPVSVAKRAATIIADEAWQAVADHGAFVMAVSGGHTPWKVLRALTDMTVPWQAVHIFQVDERVAPAGHADRNLTHLRESLKGAPIRPEQICAMPVESPELEAAADCYASLLRQLTGAPPVIDLLHLGLAPDGHTASLVPGDPVLEVDQADVALSGPYQGHRRMTLTYPILKSARRVLWVVTGEDKTPMVDRLLAGDSRNPGRTHTRRSRLAGVADRVAALLIAHQNEGVGSCSYGIAADHGGYELKEDLASRLRDAGHDVTDYGAHGQSPGDDYPDYVIPLAHAVATGNVQRGIAVCGSGVVASVCAQTKYWGTPRSRSPTSAACFPIFDYRIYTVGGRL